MPIQHAISNVADKPIPLVTSKFAIGHKLEEIVVTGVHIVCTR
jgi:hypothetical protein